MRIIVISSPNGLLLVADAELHAIAITQALAACVELREDPRR